MTFTIIDAVAILVGAGLGYLIMMALKSHTKKEDKE